MTDYYTRLPDDLLYEIALGLNLKELFQQCRVSKRMSELCNNNDFWYQRSIQDLGSSGIDWQGEYVSKINKIVESQNYWRKRYTNEFGDDINFKSRYINSISNDIRGAIGYSLYKAQKYNYNDDNYNDHIVNYFELNPEARYTISLPGLKDLKERVRDFFRYLLKNHREQYPTLQQLYNEIFVL